MNNTLKFIVPGKPEFIGPVRVAVAVLAGEMGFDVEAVEDVKMAVSEACTKAICPGAGAFGLYEVTCCVNEKDLTIRVIDREGGCRLSFHEAPCEECTHQDGLGLTMLKALMDEVTTFEEPDAGTGIRMVKNLR